MHYKKMEAARRKVASLIKGKLAKYIREGGDIGAESAVAGEVLLYWTKDTDCYMGQRYVMLAGYECGKGGIGRCLFCAWWSGDRWEIKVHDVCPPVLGRAIDDIIEEVNDEKEEG